MFEAFGIKVESFNGVEWRGSKNVISDELEFQINLKFELTLNGKA